MTAQKIHAPRPPNTQTSEGMRLASMGLDLKASPILATICCPFLGLAVSYRQGG